MTKDLTIPKFGVLSYSSKAYVYDETIYNSCAWAHFAGCTYLRHIILALNPILHTWFRDTCFTGDGCPTIQVFLLIVYIGMGI
jgi:hypothetical protein